MRRPGGDQYMLAIERAMSRVFLELGLPIERIVRDRIVRQVAVQLVQHLGGELAFIDLVIDRVGIRRRGGGGGALPGQQGAGQVGLGQWPVRLARLEFGHGIRSEARTQPWPAVFLPGFHRLCFNLIQRALGRRARDD